MHCLCDNIANCVAQCCLFWKKLLFVVGIWWTSRKTEKLVEYWHPLCWQPSSWRWKRRPWRQRWWPRWSRSRWWTRQLPRFAVSRRFPWWSPACTLQWEQPWTCAKCCRWDGFPKSRYHQSLSLGHVSTFTIAGGWRQYLSWMYWSALKQWSYTMWFYCAGLLPCSPLTVMFFHFVQRFVIFFSLCTLFPLLPF